MNIDGFGKKLVELFLEKDWITDFVSVYHLTDHRAEMLELEGFKEKSVMNLMSAIDSSRRVDLASFLVSLGIPQVGRKTGKMLAKYIAEQKSESSVRLLSEIMTHLTYEELESVRDIGPVGAGSIVYYFEENGDLITRLISELDIVLPTLTSGSIPGISQEGSRGIIFGKSFCVT